MKEEMDAVRAEVRDAIDEAEEAIGEVVDGIENDDYVFGHRGGRSITFSFEGSIWPLAVLAFLAIGFIWESWNVAWVVFPAAWILGEIIRYIRYGKVYVSLYSIATVIYLVMGFVWGLWHPGWLIFVAAWAINSMFPYKKRGKKKKNNNVQ
jgi:hypothetical protein